VLAGITKALPAGQAGGRHLRIWSAGCATGEEPYTIAMLLEEAIADLDAWDLMLLATDVNSGFLQAAKAGVYREWSFRGVPRKVKERYFQLIEDGDYILDSRVRERVTFSSLNLVESDYPGDGTLDVILCRNVLMYLDEACAELVVGGFAKALRDDGWLIVGAAETALSIFDEFDRERFSNAVLFRKRSRMARAVSGARIGECDVARRDVVVAAQATISPASAPDLDRSAIDLFRRGRYADAAEAAMARLGRAPDDAEAMTLLARIEANSGALDQALLWAERALAANRIDPAGHFVHALILLELCDPAEAVVALNRVVYLAPDHVFAHYMLGVLASNAAMLAEAKKHFDTAGRILSQRDPDGRVEDIDRLRNGELFEMVRSLHAALANEGE
jgi:chemotaxis protein methyltransferase CheR